jgi:hypothetical protein
MTTTPELIAKDEQSAVRHGPPGPQVPELLRHLRAVFAVRVGPPGPLRRRCQLDDEDVARNSPRAGGQSLRER